MGADIIGTDSAEASFVNGPSSVADASVVATQAPEKTGAVKEKVAPTSSPVISKPAPVTQNASSTAAKVESTQQSATNMAASQSSNATVLAVSAEEEALLKRAARFGVPPVPKVQAKVEETKKALRAERFGIPVQQKATTEANVVTNKKKNDAEAVIEDPVMKEKLLKRAERFGVVSSVLKQVQAKEEESHEVRFNGI